MRDSLIMRAFPSIGESERGWTAGIIWPHRGEVNPLTRRDANLKALDLASVLDVLARDEVKTRDDDRNG